MAPTARKTVRIGVFLPIKAQLLDTACIDVFAMMGHGLLAEYGGLAPPALLELAPDVWIAYIAAQPAGALLPLTANMAIAATHRFSDPEVAPGTLDIVLVPGPDPRGDFDAEPLRWLREQAGCEGTDVLSVCSGVFVCGAAGLLKGGRKACGPRALQDVLKKKFGEADFVGEELRWVQDGNLWSCGKLKPPPLFFFPQAVSALLPSFLSPYRTLYRRMPLSSQSQ